MSELITKRSELLFIYDVQNANPNGDPADENKPRIDEETGLNIVTDVRLKRTIRDYLYHYKGHDGKDGKDIFVRQTFVEDDETKGINDGKGRAEMLKNDAQNIIAQCIDIRLFGGVIPLDKASITFTGPVQFKMGHSLHKVQMQYIKGTGAFASKKGNDQNTFREEYILPYSLIAFYGIVNENAAQKTRLTDADVEELKDALWNGTKNLITRSKMEHNPRLLLMITHDESNYFIGDLDHLVSLKSTKQGTEIRCAKDFTLDMSELSQKISALEKDGRKPSISMQIDDKIRTEGWTH